MVVVVVFSFDIVVPASVEETEPETVVDEDEVDGVLAGGLVTTVVEELEGGGVVVLGTTTVVFSVVEAGVVVVFVVRSQPVMTALPSATSAMAGISLFMLSPIGWGIRA